MLECRYVVCSKIPPNAAVVRFFDLIRQIFKQCVVHTIVPAHHVGHAAFFRVDFCPACGKFIYLFHRRWKMEIKIQFYYYKLQP